MTIKWNTLKTAEQKEDERISSLIKQIKSERDKRLAATDFYMLEDTPPAPVGVQEYRKALRDLPLQDGFPENIIWPELIITNVPSKVTRRQALTALSAAGHLQNIELALENIPDSEVKKVALIYWKESLHFERNNPLLNQLATSIGLSQLDLDDLFINASSI